MDRPEALALTSLAYRPADDGDIPFAIGTWLSSYRKSRSAGIIPMPMYQRVYDEAMKWIMARPGARTWVAYHPGISRGALADLHGWCCVELGGPQPVIHYVYVKKSRRRHGLATSLLRAAGVDVRHPFSHSFETEMALQVKDRIPHARWDPLLARCEPKEKECQRHPEVTHRR